MHSTTERAAILNYGYDNPAQAKASLREFSAESGWREAHKIVRYYSEKDGRYRYSRVLISKNAKQF
jgi:hypothetical protein